VQTPRYFISVSVLSCIIMIIIGLSYHPVFSKPLVSQTKQLESATVAPPRYLNYQGYLTDGQGQPLNGSQTLAFALYQTPQTETPIWGPELHEDVSVQQGLFQVVLGESIGLTPNLFRQALWLQVAINQTVTMPLQPLQTVPYAFGLIPGATIEGEPVGSVYALTAINNSANPQGRGLWAVGSEYGLMVQETGAGDVALKSTSFVEAQGYKSTEPSYWWVSGMTGLPANPTELTLRPTVTGTAILTSHIKGPQAFHIPITLASELYGQAVQIDQMTIHYLTSHADSAITRVRLEKQQTVVTSETVLNEITRLDSTIATSAIITITDNNRLTAEEGLLHLQLTLDFASPTHTIFIGGIRLRLVHHD